MKSPLIAQSAVVCFICLWLTSAAEPAIIYVDNRKGDDTYDGSDSEPTAPGLGPVFSIRRALQLANGADTIVIANNGIPYYESLALFGPRHSGIPNFPFTIVGNGAVIDGSRPVPAGAWERVGIDLFRLRVFRKGWYQLVLDGRAVPEHKLSRLSTGPEEIPAGEWGVWKGAIYYHGMPLTDPAEMNFGFAHEASGISLHRVFYVRIVDLQIQNFRIDGVAAPDLCDAISVEQVRLLDNGRAGLATGGTSRVNILNSRIAGNREAAVLIRGLSGVNIEQSNLSADPILVD